MRIRTYHRDPFIIEEILEDDCAVVSAISLRLSFVDRGRSIECECAREETMTLYLINHYWLYDVLAQLLAHWLACIGKILVRCESDGWLMTSCRLYDSDMHMHAVRYPPVFIDTRGSAHQRQTIFVGVLLQSCYLSIRLLCYELAYHFFNCN